MTVKKYISMQYYILFSFDIFGFVEGFWLEGFEDLWCSDFSVLIGFSRLNPI